MNEILFAVGAGIIVQSIILYIIILNAVRANIRYKTAWGQMALLAEIAKKQGVDEKIVADILNHVKE